jgi:hypothetical protein
MRASAGGSETDRGTKCNHQRVWPQASVAVEYATARTDDVLHLRLNHPPLCPLGLVHHLDHGFPAPHRVEKVSERSDVGIEPPGIVPDPRIGEGNSDLVIRPTGYDALVNQASVGVKIDQVTIVWCAASANKRRRARLVSAIARGRRWLDDVVSGRVTTVAELCAREMCSVRQVNMMISLAFLAPNLVKAVVEGRLPRGIGVERLCDPPTEWSRQFEALGLNPE